MPILVGVWLATMLTAADIPALAWQPRSDWVNVCERGAVGDGEADDTTAIQAVMDAVQDGTTVYFPPGRFRLTATLTLLGPRHGVLIVGHGRDTALVWDGPVGQPLFRDDGVAYSRFVGLSFEGRGRASIGFYHYSDRRFETEVRCQHLAFRDFTDAGILAAPDDRYALAETLFENCLFERCARGAAFLQFNDYDLTFDGCEFRDCGIGIECRKGNLYARNSHFERSATADVLLSPEHGSSLRRCTSVGSRIFLDYQHPVGPLTVQDCHVAGWTGPDGAISISGAPVMLFDCSFADAPDGLPPVRAPRRGQRLVISGNRPLDPAELLRADAAPQLYVVPPGRRAGAVTSATQRFLKDAVDVPRRVFDAKAQFGAAGDGRTDDTVALQRCIDAARGHGRGALAYLPSGHYLLTATLRITGEDYRVGGSGFGTRLLWRGAEGSPVITVESPRRVGLEHLMIGHHDLGPMNHGPDVLQTADGPSSMTYDGVYVFGMYQKQPFVHGLWLQGLGPEAVVNLVHVQGNLRIVDSAAATILGGCTYEGSITVEGRGGRRDGLLGFLTRLCTLCTHALYLRDSHHFVASDFYIEQADNGLVFEGRDGDPPGRATIQGAKLQFSTAGQPDAAHTVITVDNYHGSIFLGPDQFYVEPALMPVRQSGAQPVELFFAANAFYNTRLVPELGPAGRIYRVANDVFGDQAEAIRAAAADTDAATALERLTEALDDLRRLGEVDLRLNHPDVPRAGEG